MNKLISGLTTLLIVCYPFFIFFSLGNISLRWIISALLVLFTLRLAILWRNTKGVKQRYITLLAILSATLGISISLYSLLENNINSLLFYPVLINLLFLFIFLFSLFSPPSIIEIFARMIEKEIPPQGLIYIRKVTWAWCVFFLLNGMISLYTALQDNMLYWTWYNGFISYLLIGIFFIVELVIRHYVRKKQQ